MIEELDDELPGVVAHLTVKIEQRGESTEEDNYYVVAKWFAPHPGKPGVLKRTEMREFGPDTKARAERLVQKCHDGFFDAWM